MAAKKPQSVPCANVCGPDINSGIKGTDLIYFLLPLSISWQNASAVRWRFNVQCVRNLKLARQCVTSNTRHHEIESARLGARLGSPVISRAPLAPATVKRARHPPSLSPPSSYPPTAQPHPWAWVAQNRGSLLWLITFLRCRQWHDMIFFVFCFSHFFCLLFFWCSLLFSKHVSLSFLSIALANADVHCQGTKRFFMPPKWRSFIAPWPDSLYVFFFFARVEIFIFKSLKMAHKFIVKVTKGGQSEGDGNILEICLAKSLCLK